MQLLPVKAEFPYNPIGSYYNGNPYAIAFVYPQKGQAYIVKGGLVDVEAFLIRQTEPCIVHIGYFAKGKARCTHTEIRGLSPDYKAYISYPQYPRENEVYYDEDFHKIVPVRNIMRRTVTVVDAKSRKTIFEKKLRKMPRKWMKELDQYVV